jgi:Fe-S cluster assembly protein SufD
VFDPSAAAAITGPDWLERRRAEAAGRLSSIDLPSADEEVWRYSRIAELDPAEFAPATVSSSTEMPAAAVELLDALRARAGAVVVHNGFVVHAALDPAVAADGVRLAAVSTLADGEALLAETEADLPHDAFGVAARAFGPDPVVLVVPAGVVVEQPVVVIDWIDGPDIATFPSFHLLAGRDSQVNVLEWHGSDDVVAMTAPSTSLAVGDAARVGHVLVQDRGPQVWQIGHQSISVGQDATVTGAQAGLGGDYARNRVDCRLTGRGATGNLIAVYFGEGHQMLDFRTFQDHRAPDTTSNLLFKGAVGGHSQSVYTGLIHVGKQARGTNAFQTNRNIKLSEGAWAESVPNLEIENNDVRCSHASTVGPVDEEQRFYLESRGVPTTVAERLIVAGFFEEVVRQMPIPEVAPLLEIEIDRRLARRDAP